MLKLLSRVQVGPFDGGRSTNGESPESSMMLGCRNLAEACVRSPASELKVFAPGEHPVLHDF